MRQSTAFALAALCFAIASASFVIVLETGLAGAMAGLTFMYVALAWRADRMERR